MRTSDVLKKVVPLLVVLTIVGFLIHTLFSVGRHTGYAPTQPIPFSHKIHADVNSIPCMYCHSNVEKSKHATVPALNVCMNCHSVVAPDSPHIKKLKEFHAKGKPIEWVKVNDLPDFVTFSHKRHVKRGVNCETCHGDIKEMSKVKQGKVLTMGWCLDCHRGDTTPDYVFNASNWMDREHPPVKGTQVAPTDCLTCHN